MSRRSDLVKTLSAALIAVALLAGVGLRVERLDQVPPGLLPDEACDGYDAYSLLTTGRDHHGNFIPIAIQAFSDYRPPIFDYSLVPLIAEFGLKPAVVRLGAALWGTVDLAAATCLAGMMLGWPGAAAAAVLGALMPWHLEFSRFGQEAITGSATVTLALACFFAWLSRRKTGYLMVSAVFFGLSLYSYSIVKLFTPLMIGLLTILYWRELRQAWPKAMIALGVIAVLATPEAVLTLRHPAEMQARFHQESLDFYMACPGCLRTAALASSDSTLARVENFSANFASHFTPSFLFLNGDRGDHWTMLHPLNFGELLPEQAPLVVLALIALFSPRRRRVAILILGWLMLAAAPAALLTPMGVQVGSAAPGKMPIPHILFNFDLPQEPLTPSLLIGHASSLHDVLAMAPWILLSALGFVVLLDLISTKPALQAGAVCLILAGVIFHSARFAHAYFEDFPTLAAPYFQYGIEEFLQTIDQRYGSDLPVVITPRINQPYIYVLFFERYPPAAYQRGPVLQQPGLFGPVRHFGRYWFVPPNWASPRLAHGIFVFHGDDPTPKPPDASIRYPDGSVAYKIVVK